jgi:hypothetical protein
MCLREIRKPGRSSGIAYKIIYQDPKTGVYRSQHPFFLDDGRGGIPDAMFYGNVSLSDAVYRKGEKYTVNHNRQARVNFSSEIFYPAGVHLYRTRSEAEFKNQWNPPGFVIKKFKYNRAIACDKTIIVAMEVTLLED